MQVTPDFARTHPKGPLDFGAMAHNIDWAGVLKDLGVVAAGAVGGAGWGEAAGVGAAGTGALPKASPLLAKLAAAGIATQSDVNQADKAQKPRK